jgi:hypothetical protein
MENHDLDQALRRQLTDSAPAAVHEEAERHFQALAAELQLRSAASASRSRLIGRWLWAGVSLAGAAAAALAVLLLVSPAPSWAKVTERFRGLRFFNATVYFTDLAGRPSEKIDLWVAQDHRLRAHYHGLMFFGEDGRVSKVLSAETGEEIPLEALKTSLHSRDEAAPDPYPALALVRGIARLGEMPHFSLDNLLQLFCSQREELHPTLNTDLSLKDDMQVFDITGRRAPEWIRLWVLRRSELPVRLRVWNPSDGEQIDMLFDYATQMPEEAFDAGKVQTTIRQKHGDTNRLYSLLQDSGDRPLTPEQLFAARGGYHLPEIDTVGRTEDGLVWVLSRNVENWRSDGKRIYGWDRLTDDLGQPYVHRFVGWLAENGTVLEYFVPADRGGSFRLPREYTLVCTDRPEGEDSAAAGPVTVIGTIVVKSWQEKASIPDLLKAQQNQIGGRTNWQLVVLDEALEQQDWPRFDDLAAALSGAPEEDPVALARDVKIAHRLILANQRETAVALCARLYPLVRDAVQQGDPLRSNVVRWHIADLYRAGRRDDAQRLANRHTEEAMQRSRVEGPRFIVDLILELHLAGMTEPELRAFFGQNVVGIPVVRDRINKLQVFGEAQPITQPVPASFHP